MSDSDRGRFFEFVKAAVGVTVAVLTVIAAFSIGQSTALNRSRQQSNSTHYAENAEKEIKERCALLQPIAMAECIREVIKPQMNRIAPKTIL